MPTRTITAFALFAMLLIAYGADEKFATLKVGGQIYSNVTVTTVTATDIHFFYPHGISNAKLKDLDPDLQKHFHYDAATAQTREQQQAAANEEYVRKLRGGQSAPPAASQPAPAAAPPLATGPDDIVVPKLYAKSFLHQKAPAFIVEKWLTPQPNTDGKFILIDFWATWCGPCKKAIPHLNGLHAKYKDQIVFVGVSDESEADVRKLADPKIDYSVAIDPQRRMESAVEVQGIPHAMLIDPHGYVRFEGMPNYLNEQNLGKLLARYSK